MSYVATSRFTLSFLRLHLQAQLKILESDSFKNMHTSPSSRRHPHDPAVLLSLFDQQHW